MTDLAVLAGAAASGWVITRFLVPPLAALCRRRGWLDQPGPRKSHLRPTPRLTGVALFAAIWVTLVLCALFLPRWIGEFASHATVTLAGALLMLALGVVDDLRPLSGLAKLIGQASIGSLLFAGGIGFDRLWVPFVGGIELGILSWPVTLVWFLVLVNAVNIIDGMDGLAVSTTAVATLPLIWVSWTLHLPAIWIGAAALCGGLIAFWKYNRPPATVFMGDSGSLTLGYFLAIVALLAPIKRFTALAFFVPILALLLPLAESAFAFGRRSWARTNPLGADSGHLHHRLLDAGWSQGRILIAYNGFALALGAFCVGFRYGNRRLLAILLGIFVLSIILGLGIILRQRVGSGSNRSVHRATEG
ncbi:MAG: undecaprenyl/decaprenyl-phosphate alpha-N-acetylglucosaminyl 1-phosphate transferase [candidate division Zixibacteria bacterium]|nr:undecaprenyl/decaprenyl-phosphate alpha-N-acetylglucosaminyl 1-phosphate transferase [candidate division Zixibacteria bacterium]